VIPASIDKIMGFRDSRENVNFLIKYIKYKDKEMVGEWRLESKDR